MYCYINLLIFIGELRNSKILYLLLFFNFIFIFYLFYYHYLYEEDDYSLMSGGTTWGDIPLHISIIQSFLHGKNQYFKSLFSIPYSPFFAGERLYTPFLPHIHRASLIIGGMNLRESLLIPNIILTTSFIGLLYQLYQKIFHGKKILSILTIILSILSGGIGSILWIIFYGMNLRCNMDLDFLERWLIDENHTLPWWGFYGHIILPQLDAVYGYPLAISIWLILYIEIKKPQYYLYDSYKIMIISGLFTILLSLYHIHSYISILLFCIAYIIISPNDIRKPKILTKWIIFGLISIISIPICLIYFGRIHSYSSSVFFGIKPFWSIFTIVDYLFGKNNIIVLLFKPILFWFIAIGLYFPLSIYGMFYLEPSDKKFIKATWILFICGNIFYFQPYHSQNLKIFCLWIFMGTIPIVKLFYKIWKQSNNTKYSIIIRFILIITLFLMILSGSLAIRRDIKQYAPLLTEEDVKAGEWILKNTKYNSIFLSSESHANVAICIAGRTLYNSYEGWMVLHDYPNYLDRSEIRQKILSADKDINILRELQNGNVSYVMIDPEIIQTNSYNRKYWSSSSQFELVYESKNYLIFAIPQRKFSETFQNLLNKNKY